MNKGVAIVGGGMIGLTLSILLVENSIPVDLYERKERVGINANKASGVLSINGIDRLKIDCSGAKINTLSGAEIYSKNKMLSVISEDDKAYVLDREKLVENAYRKAVDVGVNVHLNSNLSKNDILKMSDEFSVVVGADGAVSSVASAFNFKPIKRYTLTYKAVYNSVDYENPKVVKLFFNNSVSNGFFGWAIPYGKGKIEVGIGIDDRYKITSYKAFKELLKNNVLKNILNGDEPDEAYASMIPAEMRKETVKGNVILIGDAAGQVKSTTGGGLIYGLSIAKCAQRAIVEHIKDGKPLSDYEKYWKKRYMRELKLHMRVHSYYSRLSNRQFDLTFSLLKKLGAESFLSKYGDMDSINTMIKRFFIR